MVLAPLIAGGNHHLANQRADVFAGLPVGLGLGQRFGETDYLATVVLSYVRMHIRQVGGSLGQTRFDFDLLLLQLNHSCLHGRLVHTILNGIHDPFDTARDLLQGAAARFCLCPPLMVLAVGLLSVGTHRDRHSLRGYQLVGKTHQHAPLDVIPANSPTIVADPFAEMAETAIAVVDNDAVSGATASAGEQARQEEGRTAEPIQPFRSRCADAEPGTGILSDSIGFLPGRQAKNRKNPMQGAVREIVVRMETGGTLRILSNDLDAPAKEIADLYKRRWQIELFFRVMKQTLKITHFIGRSENAVRIQIAVALIAFLLLRILNKISQEKQTLLETTRLVRTNLMHRKDFTRLKQLHRPPPLDSRQIVLDWGST